MIVEQKVAVLNIATCYICDSRKYNDIIRNFMNMIIQNLQFLKKFMKIDLI